MSEIERNWSFSTKPGEDGPVKRLKEYCKKEHISFSAMVLKGIAHVVKELKL